VEFLDGRDAEEAMYHLDGTSYGGREISVAHIPDLTQSHSPSAGRTVQGIQEDSERNVQQGEAPNRYSTTCPSHLIPFRWKTASPIASQKELLSIPVPLSPPVSPLQIYFRREVF